MGFLQKIKKALKLTDNEYGEQVTDSVLDKAATGAETVLGEENAEKIQQVRDSVDDKIGKNDA